MHFIVYALAVWRISHLIAFETGPFQVLDKIRFILGVRYDEQSVRYGKNVIAEGIICIWCNSVWFGLLWTLLYLTINPTILLIISLPLALSTVAIIIEVYSGKG